MNQKAFFGALLGLAMVASNANATVTPFFSSTADCATPVTSMNFQTSGPNVNVSLCVTTTSENVCGATVQLQSASAAEDARFKVISRTLGSSLSDPNSSISFPLSITNPKQVADLGATVGSGTPVPPAGANQLIATFALQPQATATNNSYVISLSSLSSVAIEATNCFGNPTDTPISKSLTLTLGAAVARKRFDFDGDGKSDVLWRNMGGGGTGDNYVWLMNGTNVAGEGSPRALSDLNWVVAGIGYFTADTKADILWRNTATGDNYIWPMNGAAVGAGEGFTRSIGDLNWVVAAVADFDGDGKDDILWRNTATGANYMWLMNGTAIIGEGSVRAITDLNYSVVAAGDFDGDSKADIVWRNSSTGHVYLWPMNGTTILGTEGTIRTVSDLTWQVRGFGNFDADNKTDLLWYNTATGQTYVWLMSGTTIAGEGLLRAITDTNWQIATIGDFDGDGKSDIIWRNASTGQTYFWPVNGVTIGAGEGFIRTVPGPNWTIVSK